MGSAATLRRHFGRVVGVAPDTYRRAFHHPTPHRPEPPVPALAVS
jgi:hypothetical protein